MRSYGDTKQQEQRIGMGDEENLTPWHFGAKTTVCRFLKSSTTLQILLGMYRDQSLECPSRVIFPESLTWTRQASWLQEPQKDLRSAP
eukprot:754443-Hanusia_phi.AAC.1